MVSIGAWRWTGQVPKTPHASASEPFPSFTIREFSYSPICVTPL